MKCKDVKKELELMFVGVKPGASALLHIQSCAGCRAEYNAMLKIIAALSNTEKVKVPAGFNKGVWDKIGEPAPSLLGSFLKPAFALAGAAAAALVIFMVFFMKPADLKKKDSFVSKPAVIKEKEIINKQAPLAPQEVPVVAQGEKEKQAPQENINEVSGGKMPVLVKSTGADREYLIKQEEDKNKMSAASVTKRPIELEGPLVIKNNIIKPLSGQGMTIVYKVEDTCNVLIRVYNRKGEPIKTLVQAIQGRGVYTENWMGEDKNGRVTGDGIYIVHVKTCLTEQKIKAMVVK